MLGPRGRRFSALFEAVLWTDPERVDDEFRTSKSVLLIDLSISHENLWHDPRPMKTLPALAVANASPEVQTIFFFTMAPTPVRSFFLYQFILSAV